jgi:hypothetical protein
MSSDATLTIKLTPEPVTSGSQTPTTTTTTTATSGTITFDDLSKNAMGILFGCNLFRALIVGMMIAFIGIAELLYMAIDSLI